MEMERQSKKIPDLGVPPPSVFRRWLDHLQRPGGDSKTTPSIFISFSFRFLFIYLFIYFQFNFTFPNYIQLDSHFQTYILNFVFYSLNFHNIILNIFL
jgi:hypothetical protein